MTRSLDELRRDVARAYLAKDQAAFVKALTAYKAGQSVLGKSLANVKSDEGTYGPGGTAREALGSGLAKSLTGAAQLVLPESLERGVLSKEASAERKRLSRSLEEAHPVATFVGESAPAVLAGGVAGGLTRGGLTRAGADAAGKLARYVPWAAEGAAGASVTDDSPGTGAVLGVAGGRVGQALGGALRAVGKGMKRSAAADKLLEYDADLTPGMLSPDSLWGRLERAATASPIGGGALQRARDRALNDVVPNLQADIAEVPRVAGEGLQQSANRLKGRLSSLYDPAKAVATPAQPILAARQSYAQRVAAAANREVVADDVTNELVNVWNRAEKAKNAGTIKELIADLKKTARGLRYSEKPSAADFATARVYDDAIDELQTYHELVVNNPRLIQNVKRADKIVAESKALEDASFDAQKRGSDEVKGTDVLGALGRNQTVGEFTRGSGGRVRDVGEALADAQKPRGAGNLERHPLARSILGLATIPVGIGAATPLRRLAQGTVPGQRLLGAAADSAPGRALIRALQMTRPAVPGALIEDPEE